MVGQKNVIVFLVACAFALYQFRNAKNRADLSSPTFQMKKAKQMITNHLNMFDHKVYDAKTGRGDFELLIMTNEKDGKAPQLLGRIVEDKAVTRARRNGRRHGHDYRRKKKRHHPRRRNGRHGRRDRQDHTFTPTLKLIKYDEKLTKVEYLLIRRGLITNVLNDKAKETLGKGGSRSETKNAAQEKAKEESVKSDSVKEMEKRKAEKEAEESRKSQEQAKKNKEQARKQKKKQESNEETVVAVDSDGNIEKVSNDNVENK